MRFLVGTGNSMGRVCLSPERLVFWCGEEIAMASANEICRMDAVTLAAKIRANGPGTGGLGPTPPANCSPSPAPRPPRLSSIDRVLWVWLYRLWPRCLNAMVLVRPATVVHLHCQGSPYESGLYWVGALGCRWLQIAKFPVFSLRNRQQSASKKEPFFILRGLTP